MATALKAFNKLQVGIESSKGDLATPTRVLIGDFEYEEMIERYRPNFPTGYRGNTGGAGYDLGKGMSLSGSADLSPEDILWNLLTGVRGAVTPTNHLGGSALSGTANAAVTFGATSMTDTRASWTTDEFVGATITSDGKTGVVTANTGTVATVSSWSGGTPANGSAWSIVTLDYGWAFEPQLTTGVPTIDSFAAEMVDSDGVTNHYFGKAGYGMTESIKIAWALKQNAKVDWKAFLRARQSGSPTGALVPYTTRKSLVSPLLAVYLDTTWAGLGGTQVTGVVRNVTHEFMSGYEPDPDIGSARSDLDYGSHKVGDPTAKATLTMALNATSAAYISNFRANDIVFLRLKNTGTVIGGVNRYVQVDTAMRFAANPKVATDGRQRIATFELESVVDDTSGKTVKYTALNGLAAVA